MSLFPTNRGPSHLVQFNAGKCIREGNMLKPDLRKGMIYMDQSDDQLMHFYWKERKGSAQPEDDLIIFPDEAEFVHVEQCTTGRVYLLKFKTSSQKLFFWMQNKNADKDEEVVNRVNRLIDDPHSAVDERSMSPTNMDLSADDSQDFSRILGGDDQDVNVTQEQLLQFLQTAGGMGGAVPTSTPQVGDGPTDNSPVSPQHREVTMTGNDQSQSTADTRMSAVDMENLRNMLANVNQSQQQAQPTYTLNDVLTPRALSRLLNDPDICATLFPFLPENVERTPEEVRQIAQSPQFQQALQSLSIALQSGQLGPLLTQLGLDASAGNDIESFMRAIEEQARNRENAMDED